MSEPTKDEDCGCGTMLAIGFCFFVFGIAVGCGIEDALVRAPMRAKAVEPKVAEWVVDQKKGTVEFKWKDEILPPEKQTTEEHK